MAKLKRKLDKKLKKPHLLDKVTDKLGKLVENSSLKDVTDFALMAGLAALGAKKFGTWEGSLLGPVSFKLATTQNAGGLTSPSQIAGVAGLAFLGASLAAHPMSIEPQNTALEAFWENVASKKCEEGYILEWNAIEGWVCVPKPYT